MGCDIHLHFEKKYKDGKWETIDINEILMPDDRYYAVFSFLADVRSGSDRQFAGQVASRGLPEDCSKIEYFQCPDIHSVTYAYLDEILNLPWDKANLHECYFFMFCKHTIPRLLSDLRVLSFEEKRNIRIVMGFDN